MYIYTAEAQARCRKTGMLNKYVNLDLQSHFFATAHFTAASERPREKARRRPRA